MAERDTYGEGTTTYTTVETTEVGTTGGTGAEGTGGGDRLQEAATSVADRARQTTESQVSSRVEQAVTQASESLGEVAQAVRQTGQTLRERDQDPFGTVADRAAEQVERAATYLRGKSANELLRDAEDFARRQPAVFLAGAAAVGWFAARFLKSSPPQEAGGGYETSEVYATRRTRATEAGGWTGTATSDMGGYGTTGTTTADIGTTDTAATDTAATDTATTGRGYAAG